MGNALDILKALHFLIWVFFLLCFSLWMREEFFTIFSRKRVAGIKILKVLLLKLFSRENGLVLHGKRIFLLDYFLYSLTVFFAIFPLFFIPLSDKFDISGNEVFLGLIDCKDSWFFFFVVLIAGEVTRSVYDLNYSKYKSKIPLLLALCLTFVITSPTMTLDQMVIYQKSFSDNGLRNYFLFRNPLGLLVFIKIIYLEIENPKRTYNLIDHLYLNSYVILFIFGFLGGFGLPSILELKENSSSFLPILFQSVSVMAKFIFTIIIIWIFKYAIIKPSKEEVVS